MTVVRLPARRKPSVLEVLAAAILACASWIAVSSSSTAKENAFGCARVVDDAPSLKPAWTPAPPYPRERGGRDIAAHVRLYIFVAADGRVLDVKILETTDAEAGDLAREWALKWKYPLYPPKRPACYSQTLDIDFALK